MEPQLERISDILLKEAATLVNTATTVVTGLAVPKDSGTSQDAGSSKVRLLELFICSHANFLQICAFVLALAGSDVDVG